jgi:hypothetical protein
MRPFAFAFLCSFAVACRPADDVPVTPARYELVEVELNDTGYRLSFLLPDAEWRRVTMEGPPRGFFYANGVRSLHVTIHLKVHKFETAEDEARATDAEIRAFMPGPGWPFVGVVVSYRGPPDDAMLEAFERSFKVERR